MAVTRYPTTNTILFGAAADAITDRVYVKDFHWRAATTAGHALIVHDSAGNVKVAHTASAANEYLIFPIDDWMDGITVNTMASGTLYAHLG